MAAKRSPVQPIGRPPWAVRRYLVNMTLGFCAAMVVFVLTLVTVAMFTGVSFEGDDIELFQTVVSSSFFLGGSTIGAYVFGAVWDDRNVMQILGPRAYEDQLPQYGSALYSRHEGIGAPADLDEPGMGQ